MTRGTRWSNGVCFAAVCCLLLMLGLQRASAAERLADPAAADVVQLWPSETFLTLESEHFRLLHNTTSSQARRRLDMLERTRSEFLRCFQAAGFELQPPASRLTGILFRDRLQFDEYARHADRVSMAWSLGYYSARTNRVALFQQGTGGHAHAGEFAPDADAGPAALATAQNILPAGAGEQHESSIASHEAAHQLAFNTGLQRRGVMYPLWVSEGLATCFENPSASASFGPDCDNPTRRWALLHAFDSSKAMPLDSFVAITSADLADPGMSSALETLYAQSWGVFRFLFIRHPHAMRQYLQHASQRRPGLCSTQQLREEFVTHFGELEPLQRDWERWLGELRSVAP